MSNKSLNIAKSSQQPGDWQGGVKNVAVTDLILVNSVIISAVESWQLPERLKRLSLPILQYAAEDLAEFEFFLHDHNDSVNGVAVLGRDAGLKGKHGTRCALLHGLYVHADAQRTGVGRALQQTVAVHARELGCEGLLVKAQRVARSYFEAQGYEECESQSVDYPYLYWKAI